MLGPGVQAAFPLAHSSFWLSWWIRQQAGQLQAGRAEAARGWRADSCLLDGVGAVVGAVGPMTVGKHRVALLDHSEELRQTDGIFTE